MKIIELSDICKRFDNVVALENINLSFEQGRIIALVGDNGSGKSTLIKILSGYLKPDRGRITIRGREFTYLTPKQSMKNGIAVVYQDLALDNYKNCAENIFLGREPLKFGVFLDKEKMRRDTVDLLRRLRVHISDIDVPVKYLSGGQRQALAISRAIATNSDIVILDEPTSAMSISASRKIMYLVESMKREGKTCIIINHNIFQLYDVADEIHVLHRGKVIRSFITKETSIDEVYNYLKVSR